MATRRVLSAWFAAIAVAGLCGCATAPGNRIENIGGRRVEFRLARADATAADPAAGGSRPGRGPAVIFENGLGGDLRWWARVFPDITPAATAFAYDRPGNGHSEPASTPRDAAHIVDELRATLLQLGIDPPYILVGHSMGGLYMQYFARRYPGEVAGLVLVDSTHPRQMQGAGARENWPTVFKAYLGVFGSAAARAEFEAMGTSGDEVLALPPPPASVKVVVLSATEPQAGETVFMRDVIAKRADLPNLYPGCRTLRVEGGHAIPRDHPEDVVDAIRSVSFESGGR